MHFNSELQPKDLLVSKFREVSSVAGVDENFNAHSQGRCRARPQMPGQDLRLPLWFRNSGNTQTHSMLGQGLGEPGILSTCKPLGTEHFGGHSRQWMLS